MLMPLQQSFIHIPGIGKATERLLWTQGVLNWDDLEASASQWFRSPQRLQLVTQFLRKSREAYEKKEFQFFSQNLPPDQYWRLIPEVFDQIAYLDIETTGLGFPPSSESTTITFYYQGTVYQEHEAGKKFRLVQKMLDEASIWVTFFGQSFDVPFLQKEFLFQLEKPHVDLCFWLKRLGFKGGLKKIQKAFPEIPSRLAKDLDGWDAVRLWRMHQRGVAGALDTLLTYNAEDTIVLEPLTVKAFELEMLKYQHFQDVPELIVRPWPELKTGIASEAFDLLRGKSEFSGHFATS